MLIIGETKGGIWELSVLYTHFLVNLKLFEKQNILIQQRVWTLNHNAHVQIPAVLLQAD